MCGLKKSYKDAAAPTVAPHPQTPPPFRNSVSAKLAEVAAHLEGTVRPQTTPAVGEPDPANAVNRKAVSEEIAALEASLAKLPDNGEYTEFRATLHAKIAEKKKAKTRAIPIGFRIEECRKLVSRCHARRDQAQESLRLANLTLQAADEQLLSAQQDLNALQAEFARREMPQQQSASSNSMESLTASLGQVIADMKGGGVVPAELISQTEQHSC